MILDVRLRAAADMVPRGARLADIGSDHAYLPIALCLENKIEYALASDINEGPVKAAEANVRKNRLEGRITAIKADGLDRAREFAPDCITVLGMGGELIVSILDKADWIKDEKITLVLQPMTHAEILTKYLAEQGFAIVEETIVCDGGRSDRIYRVLSAKFDGVCRELTEAEALIGELNLKAPNAITKAYIERHIRVLETRIAGKESANTDAESEKKLCNQLKNYL